jgi:hypothetical protein
MKLQPQLPKGCDPLPKGYTYLGLGGTFVVTSNRFNGLTVWPNQKWENNCITLNGLSSTLHYAAPNDSEIVKLNGFTANLIKDMPRELPPLPVGYVYLGEGGTFKTVKKTDIGLFTRDRRGWDGPNRHTGFDVPKIHYAALQDSEIVKLNSSAQESSGCGPAAMINPNLQEEITKAESMIGSFVDVRGSRACVKFWEIAYEHAALDIGEYYKEIRPLINQKKIVVLLRAVWDNGTHHKLCLSADPSAECYPKPWVDKPKIVVNGYTGEEKGETWVFGCAVIDKSVLFCARKFLEEEGKNCRNQGNRDIKSVKIGEVDFTLEILKQMGI